MNKAEKAIFKKKAERHFRSQRELPPGRNFRWNTFWADQYEMSNGKTADENYRDNFDSIFPNAPGAGI